jgi:hypothetical protein
MSIKKTSKVFHIIVKTEIEIDVTKTYPHIGFLKQFVPYELKNLVKDKTMVNLGMGRDVWLPFGILNAKNVIAYDLIDPVVALVGLGYKTTFRERFYGYANNLALDILSFMISFY